MSITTRSNRAAVVRTILAVLFGIVLVVLLVAAWFVRSSLPKLDGKFSVAGLSAPVYIRRDERGTPHIEAQTIDDAFFAEGFACGQDRLWQMDTVRRRAEGRVSEIVGPATLKKDEYIRTLGLPEAAEADVRLLDARTRVALEAYAAGVNAAAAARPLPLEFRLLGYGWQPWTVKDSVAIGKLMSQTLDDDWYYPQLRAAFVLKFGPAAAAALTDMQIPHLERYIPGYAPKPLNHTPIAAVVERSNLFDRPVDLAQHEPDTGSNNWIVAGRRTSTGRPVLSNDTHLGTTLPSTWWTADVHGGAYHVAGFTLPGIAGVVIGHNDHIAWGITSATEAVQDLYIERFRSATSDEYLANGSWRRAQHRTERIGVLGHPDVILDVLVTRHGPIVKREGARGLALAWTALRGGRSSRALLGIQTAADYQQFRAALADWLSPVSNFGYADTAGHIGYQDAGAVPLRADGDGSLPVEGQDDRFAWKGDVPYDTLPHALDPPGGVLATANNALVPPSFRPSLSPYFEPPFRVHRIYDRLRAMRGATPEAIGSVQGDIYDYPHQQLARATERALATSSDPAMQRIARQLHGWDGMMDRRSGIPTFMMAEEAALVRDLYEPRMGTAVFESYGANYWPIVPILRALEGDDRLRSIGLSRGSLTSAIARAAGEAATAVSATGPRGLDGARAWGVVNAALYQHPLSVKWPLGILSVPPVPQPGSGFAVYAGKPEHGPSERLVVDMSDFDNTSMLLTLGESGQYSDPNYDDELEDFAHVRWSPMPFSQQAVLAAAKHTLVLEPGP